MSDFEEEKEGSHLSGSHLENIETENLDEKRSSEILNPNLSSPPKPEFMKNSYQVDENAPPEEKKLEEIKEIMEKSQSATLNNKSLVLKTLNP